MPLAGVAVFLVLRAVRAVLVRRYVAACVARGGYNPYRSPAFGLTFAAWLVDRGRQPWLGLTFILFRDRKSVV